MEYSLDTDPPSFPAGVKLEDLFSLLDGIKDNFDIVFRVLPHAVAAYIFAQPCKPDEALLSLKTEIDERFQLLNIRYALYPLIFGSVQLCPLMQEQFAEFHEYFMAAFEDDSLFQATFDVSDNTESEADAGPNIVFPTYPGCFLAEPQILARFRHPLSSSQTRFLLETLLRADTKFLLFEEVSEMAIWLLSTLAVTGCTMREFEPSCRRVFDFLGEIENQTLIEQEYNAFQASAGPYGAFDDFVQYVIEPRLATDPQRCCKTLEHIITESTLSVDNLMRLMVYMFEGSFETTFQFASHLENDASTVELRFDDPFAEELLLSDETTELVDGYVNQLDEQHISKFVALAQDYKHLTFVQLIFLLRIMSLRGLTVQLGDLEAFITHFESRALFLELLAYDQAFLDFSPPDDKLGIYYNILSRFLLERFEDAMRPSLEGLISRAGAAEELRPYANEIEQTFLKQNSDEVQLNLNTYAKLFRRNDNLVLQLADRFFQGEDDCQLAELALLTLHGAGSIPSDILRVLTVRLFDFALGSLYENEVPTEAVACLTAFYSSYDVSPQFCGAVNGLRGDFLRIYENLRLQDANFLLLPGFLLIMTSLFEAPAAAATEALFNYIQNKNTEELIQMSKGVESDFASYSFVFSAAVRLVLLNGPENADVSVESGKQIVEIFTFYAKAASHNYEIIITIIEALVEAFQGQFGSVMAVFRRMGRILSCLVDTDVKQLGGYVERPIGAEILILAIGGLICFEMGPQWGSNEYINSKYTGFLLQEVAARASGALTDAQILRQIYAIKYVRNSLMGDQRCNSAYYMQYTQICKAILRNAQDSRQQQEQQQAAISLLVSAMCCPAAQELDCRPQGPVFGEIMAACQRLTWEDENSLSIVYSMIEQLLEKRMLRGRQAADASRVLVVLERYLHEEEGSGGDF